MRSIRIYPHLQDTGGFFICLMRKTGPIPEDPHNKHKKTQQEQSSDQEKETVSHQNQNQNQNMTQNNQNIDTKAINNTKESQKERTDEKKQQQQQQPNKECPQKRKKLPYGSVSLKEEPFIPLTDQHNLRHLQEVRSSQFLFLLSLYFPNILSRSGLY